MKKGLSGKKTRIGVVGDKVEISWVGGTSGANRPDILFMGLDDKLGGNLLLFEKLEKPFGKALSPAVGCGEYGDRPVGSSLEDEGPFPGFDWGNGAREKYFNPMERRP